MSLTRRIVAGTIGFALTAVATACAAISVDDLPQPGETYSGGYDIVMEFDNVLSLPERAKVLLDGRTVGVVRKIAVAQQQVDVTARISPDVTVPVTAHAALQQATVLGDTYIALDRGSSTAPTLALAVGGRIPLAQTTSPPQLEDTIANLANFVASGSIQRIQNTIMSVNRVTPDQPGEVREIASRFSADIKDLSDNIDSVDLMINYLGATGAEIDSKISSYEMWFSSEGRKRWARQFTVMSFAGKLIPTVGSIYSGGYWFIPLFTSMADAIGAVQQSKGAFEHEVPAWRHLFADYFLPQDKYPAINITSIIGPDGRELSDNVHDVLRILGATP